MEAAIMKNQRVLVCMLAAASVALTLPRLSQAESPLGGASEHCMAPSFGELASRDAPFVPTAPPMIGLPPPDFLGLPPFPAGVALTEIQQDKIFTIVHAVVPLMYEQNKRARKSADEIRDMMTSGQFDESKLRALAESNSRAMVEIMVLHAQRMHQILSLLTPEQRAQLDAIQRETLDVHQPTGPSLEIMRNKGDVCQGINWQRNR